jgi:threonine aldolase
MRPPRLSLRRASLLAATVDLRSDTVTQPTPAMRAAMAAAPLGDDVFADDPSVNALQEKIAGMLGFEAALFVPTGTQSNLCAILSHCQRGDEYIVGQMQHSYRWEGGGAAVFGSVQPQPLNHAPDGSLPLADIEAAIKPDDAHFARTRLLALENTLGGKLIPFSYVQEATELARARAWAATWTARACSTPQWRRPRRLGADARTEARRIANALTVFRCASARAWARRWARPCAAAVTSSRAPTASARWPAVACARPACWRQPHRMRWTTTLTGWRMTTPWRGGWPMGWPASMACRWRRRTPISCSWT